MLYRSLTALLMAVALVGGAYAKDTKTPAAAASAAASAPSKADKKAEKRAKKAEKEATKAADAAATTGKEQSSSAKPQVKADSSKTATAGNTDAPGAIAKCKDGTYSHAKSHSGACSRHGGVSDWLDK